MRYFLVICFMRIMMLFALPAAAFANDAGIHFLTLADIHFNPYDACFGVKERPCPVLQRLIAAPVSGWPAILAAGDNIEPRYRRDTNYILLQKSLAGAHEAAVKNQADFVLVLGDTLGHDFRYYYKKYAQDKSRQRYREFVHKTFEFVNQELAKAFPDISVFMVVGNNDTYSDNYQSVPGGDFFRQTGVLWSGLIKNTKERDAMRVEFLNAGYYALDMPADPRVRIIILNSILFSTKSMGSSSALAAEKQLDWLRVQLEQAKQRHQKVLLALHIPPALDVYATRYWRLFTFFTFWQPEILKRFKAELSAYYPQIIAVMSGHLHYDWSQPLRVGAHQDIPVISVPSVSPIFGNDPEFRVYDFSIADNRISDMYSYTYPVQGRGTWRIEHVYNMLKQP